MPMFRIFRKLRINTTAQSGLGKYLIYAIGEIILVVIGILIALQLNIKNEAHKTRNRELIYLQNLKEDLHLNIRSLQDFTTTRQRSILAIDTLIQYFEGEQALNLTSFNSNNLEVLEWYPFVQNANTYQEMMNSGNLALISNREIKSALQNMETQYEKLTFVENEMQQDYERYLYEPYFRIVDLNSSFQNDTRNGRQPTNPKPLDPRDAAELLGIKLYKNGLILAGFNTELLIEVYQDLIIKSEQLIQLIDEEQK
jgi:hypothetical protein